MNHPSDDLLLKAELELLDEPGARELAEHLAQCEPCRARMEKIQNDTRLLGEVRASGTVPPLPKPRAQTGIMYTLLKAAALLIVGFLAGFTASRYSCPPPVTVVQSYLTASTPADTITQFAVCDPVDIPGLN